jgi:hypothetical protein
MKYIFLFIISALFIYWAIGADNWGEAILFSALAAFDIYLGLSNIFGKKDE